jgi:hypothetical protein
MRFGAPVTDPRHEDAALRQEEAAAVEVALAGLPDHEREAVVAQEVEGVDTATLAEARQSTPGGQGPAGRDAGPARPRLPAGPAPGRAPTARCRPVLLALSAGDRRRATSPWTPAATYAVPDLRR